MSQPIEWSDELLTGIPEVDRQHRILVDTLIAASAASGDVDAGAQFDRLTRDLLAYAIYHFDTEEQLMRQYHYAAADPETAERHLFQHRHFPEQVLAIRSAPGGATSASGSRDALLEFMRGWLSDHILTLDRRLGEFLRAAAPPPPR